MSAFPAWSGVRTYAVIGLAIVTQLGCHGAPRQELGPPPKSQGRLEDYIPKTSTGRKPAGTRDDPFVGEGVIIRILKPEKSGLVRVALKHRAIPYFKRAVEAAFYVPQSLLEGVHEGDFVNLYYARLLDGTPAALAYARALKQKPTDATEHIPHVWFGYELFRMTPIPDEVFHARRPQRAGIERPQSER